MPDLFGLDLGDVEAWIRERAKGLKWPPGAPTIMVVEAS
jgi:hypothetical protein